jgi:hypothetical protein
VQGSVEDEGILGGIEEEWVVGLHEEEIPIVTLSGSEKDLAQSRLGVLPRRPCLLAKGEHHGRIPIRLSNGLEGRGRGDEGTDANDDPEICQ